MTGQSRREPLTDRQREVLDLLARGRTNAQIAEQLGISLDGAKWHVSEVIGRLGVESREEAAMLWRMERRPLRRFRGWIAGIVGGRVPITIAGGGLAVAAIAALAYFLLGELQTKSDLDADVPMPALPADLADPAVPTLVYVDASQTESPFTAQIVRFDVVTATEISRTPFAGSVGYVARLGNSILAIHDGALVQFDFDGAPFRTVYSASGLRFFALSSDNTRAIVTADDQAVIVDLATGDVIERVSAVDFPAWAAEARLSTPAWLEDGNLAFVRLIRQEGQEVQWPGYVLVEPGRDPVFIQAAQFLQESADGSMLLEAVNYGLCRAQQPPRVLETLSGAQVVAMPAISDVRLDVLWSGSGTILSRNATEVEDDGPCRETPQATVYWEEWDPATGSASPLDFGPVLLGIYRDLLDGAIEVACGPAVPLRFTNGAPDCPAGSAFGFYFRGASLNAINPQLFLGVYEP